MEIEPPKSRATGTWQPEDTVHSIFLQDNLRTGSVPLDHFLSHLECFSKDEKDQFDSKVQLK